MVRAVMAKVENCMLKIEGVCWFLEDVWSCVCWNLKSLRTMEAAVQKNIVDTQAVLIDFSKASQTWIPSQHHRVVPSVPWMSWDLQRIVEDDHPAEGWNSQSSPLSSLRACLKRATKTSLEDGERVADYSVRGSGHSSVFLPVARHLLVKSSDDNPVLKSPLKPPSTSRSRQYPQMKRSRTLRSVTTHSSSCLLAPLLVWLCTAGSFQPSTENFQALSWRCRNRAPIIESPCSVDRHSISTQDSSVAV
jgi:hypothetical protein